MRVHPYLNFDGRTEEAFRFYAHALGGKLGDIHRFGTMPQEGFTLTEAQKQRVMHVTLELPDGQAVMGSDTMPGMGPPHVVGTSFSISIAPDSQADADRMFAGLAEGGTVTMPLAMQFWGDYYGTLTDKFGVQWMVNHTPKR